MVQCEGKRLKPSKKVGKLSFEKSHIVLWPNMGTLLYREHVASHCHPMGVHACICIHARRHVHIYASLAFVSPSKPQPMIKVRQCVGANKVSVAGVKRVD